MRALSFHISTRKISYDYTLVLKRVVVPTLKLVTTAPGRPLHHGSITAMSGPSNPLRPCQPDHATTRSTTVFLKQLHTHPGRLPRRWRHIERLDTSRGRMLHRARLLYQSVPRTRPLVGSRRRLRRVERLVPDKLSYT